MKQKKLWKCVVSFTFLFEFSETHSTWIGDINKVGQSDKYFSPNSLSAIYSLQEAFNQKTILSEGSAIECFIFSTIFLQWLTVDLNWTEINVRSLGRFVIKSLDIPSAWRLLWTPLDHTFSIALFRLFMSKCLRRKQMPWRFILVSFGFTEK